MVRQKTNQYDFLGRNYSTSSSKKDYYHNSLGIVAPNYSNEDLSVLGIHHYGVLLPIEETKRIKKSKLEKISETENKFKKMIQKVRDFIDKDTSCEAFIK
jgi:hypothetical protein